MSLNKKIVEIIRELRRLQTPQEKELWEKLRNRKLTGLKFLRQHPIVYEYRGYTPLFFVADFYCDQHKFVIEVDGKVHDFQKDYDSNRDSILKDLGLRVLRINNGELKNIEGVLNKILETVNSTHPPSPSSTHPPSPSLQSREGVSERSEDGGELAIILLAAGPSSRMGQSKQTLSILGEPLLVHTTTVAIQSNTGKVIIVLGSEEETHRQLIKGMPVEIIINSHWKTGMGSSLKAGVSHLVSHYPKTEAAIILVCDQPLLQSHHIQSLVNKYKMTGASIVASAYSNTTGVPALFHCKLFDELLSLGDNQGAKKIIQQHSAETVDFPEGAIDLDTPEEYKSFLQQHSKKMP